MIEILNNFVIHFYQIFSTVKNAMIIYQTFFQSFFDISSTYFDSYVILSSNILTMIMIKYFLFNFTDFCVIVSFFELNHQCQ